MSSKHIIGIGQAESGKVMILHGNTLQCDHAVSIMSDCQECSLEARSLKAEWHSVEHGLEPESRL